MGQKLKKMVMILLITSAVLMLLETIFYIYSHGFPPPAIDPDMMAAQGRLFSKLDSYVNYSLIYLLLCVVVIVLMQLKQTWIKWTAVTLVAIHFLEFFYILIDFPSIITSGTFGFNSTVCLLIWILPQILDSMVLFLVFPIAGYVSRRRVG